METLLDRPNPPEHIVIETSGLALPKPLVKAFTWPRCARASRSTAWSRWSMPRRRPAASPTIRCGRRAARGRCRARPRQPARGAVRGPAQLRRPDRAQQDRPVVDAARTRRDGRDRSRAAARGQAWCRPASARSIPTVLLGLGAAAEDDLDSRHSHHELEGEDHDHDDFDIASRSTCRSSTKPETCSARLLPAIDAPRHPAGEGLPRRARASEMRLVVQAVGAAARSITTTAPGRRTRTRLPRLVVIGLKGLDRAAIAARRSAALGCICSPPSRVRSPTAARPSISARRRATSSSCPRPTASSPACRAPHAHLAGAEAEPAPRQPAAARRITSRSTSMSRTSSRSAKLVVVRLLGGVRLLALRRRAGLGRPAAQRGIALALPAGRRPARPGAARLIDAAAPSRCAPAVAAILVQGGLENAAELARATAPA